MAATHPGALVTISRAIEIGSLGGVMSASSLIMPILIWRGGAGHEVRRLPLIRSQAPSLHTPPSQRIPERDQPRPAPFVGYGPSATPANAARAIASCPAPKTMTGREDKGRASPKARPEFNKAGRIETRFHLMAWMTNEVKLIDICVGGIDSDQLGEERKGYLPPRFV